MVEFATRRCAISGQRIPRALLRQPHPKALQQQLGFGAAPPQAWGHQPSRHFELFAPLCIGLRRARRSRRHVAHAASGEDEGEGEPPKNIATWRRRELVRLLSFVGPALSVPLADPLMTLIDTVCVGRAADTLQLAAMGPNTVVFNFVNYGFTFMGIATLSIIAREIAEGREGSAAKALSTAVSLAVVGGIAAMEVMRLCARHLVALAGASAAQPFFEDAVHYLRIRALSAPAMLLTVVLQSALLAQKESRVPALAVLIASAVNIVGDLLLICVWDMGAVGAAWATALSEIVAAATLLAVVARGGRLPLKLRFPSGLKELTPFAAFFGPLVVFKVSKNACYAMIQSLAIGLGTAQSAAHQAVWVLWTFIAFVPEPLSQAAQALLPERLAATEASRDPWPQRALKETLLLLVWAALLLGGLLAAVAGLVPALLPGLLAREASLWPTIASVAVPAAVSTVLSSVSCPLEGALLAKRDARYMAFCMLAILAVLYGGLHMLRAQQAGLGMVWWWLVAFFAMRIAVAFPRLWQLGFGGRPRLSTVGS